MQKVKQYADGIGPWYPMLVSSESKKNSIHLTVLAEEAKKVGLIIHPFTFRKDDGHIPQYANDFEDFLDIFYNRVEVDGVFTDFPDLAVEFLSKK